jgi:ribosomal protein S18 acetylase RimI-like enzyme
MRSFTLTETFSTISYMHSIRKYQPEDLNRLTELFDAYREFYKMSSDKAAAKLFLSERMENKESIIFVAVDDHSKLTGFVQLYPIFSSTRMQRLWLLNDLYVNTFDRGKGISTALIEAAQRMCVETDACGVILETAKTNRIGNALYTKMGFQMDSDHNYYEWNFTNE